MVVSRERKRELVQQLRSAGCCDRCVLRFLKVHMAGSYANPTATVEAMIRLFESDTTGDGGSPCGETAPTPSSVLDATEGSVTSGGNGALSGESGASTDTTVVDATVSSAVAGNGDDEWHEEPPTKYRRNAAGEREAVCAASATVAAAGSTAAESVSTGDVEDRTKPPVKHVGNAASERVATGTVTAAGLESAVTPGLESAVTLGGIKPADSDATPAEVDTPNPATPPLADMTICSSCLGVLQDPWIDDMVAKVQAQVEEDAFQFSSFQFSIFFPLATLIRERALISAVDAEFKPSDGVPIVKEVLKWVGSPRMQKLLGVKFALNSPFQIMVVVEHSESEALVQKLVQWGPRFFPGLARSKAKATSSAVNTTSLAKALQSVTNEQMKSLYSCPLPKPSAAARLVSVTCQHGSIYVAGRYCKFSRELSQTPWIIDGQRKTDESVQEIICNTLQEEAKASDVKFVSSGREDVDVRMLGIGRPFCVELVDPRQSVISQQRMTELQEVINKSSKVVQVRDLQMMDRTGVERMKEGEADKIKHYSALLFVPSGVASIDVSKLTAMKDLTIVQKTPLRVLHRRTLMDRQRTIHTMSTEAVDDQHFKLVLSSQAGTYIKEFVHGDLGRTLPNVGSILNTTVDIIELDVMAVDLDWPPSLS